MSEVDAQIEARVALDRLRLLFRQSFIANFGSFIGACLLGGLLWDAVDHVLISRWLALLAASSVVRLAVFVAYLRAPEADRTPDRWERPYWITLLSSSTVWGLGALVLMARGDPLTQVLVLFFAIGMAGSAVSVYTAYRSMTLAAMAIVLLPGTVFLLCQPTAMQRGLAVAALLFSGSVVRATRVLSDALHTAFRLTHELDRAHEIAVSAARTDVLTGLNNRRAFVERAEQLFCENRLSRRPQCALVIDIDHFKQINDRHGHAVGDLVLSTVGALLRARLRHSDLCGRLGGEEFAVLLPDTGPGAAMAVGEQLRSAIAALDIEAAGGQRVRLTASLGLAAGRQADDLQSLLLRADQAMYRAKADGRDQVAGLQAESSESSLHVPSITAA